MNNLMTACDVEGVACRDKPTENYHGHQILQVPFGSYEAFSVFQHIVLVFTVAIFLLPLAACPEPND